MVGAPRGGATELDAARRILAGIAAPASYVHAFSDGRCVGCALGVVTHDLLVVESVATLPAHRRRGVARALVEHLCTWAEGHGAHAAVLAVEDGNAAGRAAWEALGLAEIGGWSYAEAPSR